MSMTIGFITFPNGKPRSCLTPSSPSNNSPTPKVKNTTDMTLVIDAMDLLYNGNFDGFYIVSINSNFTRLADVYAKVGWPYTILAKRKRPKPSAKLATTSSTPKFSITQKATSRKREEKRKNNLTAAPDTPPYTKTLMSLSDISKQQATHQYSFETIWHLIQTIYIDWREI